MSDSNKILTVSYGTFSCTLEGFDDPFGTMRGIAEYFRDLAAEDRYFGAEPPTPDVEMLQNIAQRDVQRRVEARIGDSGVSLRPADTVEDAELAEASAPATEAPVEVAEVEDAPAANAEAAPDLDDAAEIEDAPEVETVEPEVETVETDVEDSAPLAFDDEYLMADEPEDAFTIDANAEPPAEPAPESIAEKLRRIRAVVSRNIEPKKDDAGPFDQAHAEGGWDFDAPAPKRDRALSETLRSISADIGDEDDIDALTPATGAEAETIEASGSIFAEDIGGADDDLVEDEVDALEAASEADEQATADAISGIMAAAAAEAAENEGVPDADASEPEDAVEDIVAAEAPAEEASLAEEAFEDDVDAADDFEDDYDDEDWAEDAIGQALDAHAEASDDTRETVADAAPALEESASDAPVAEEAVAEVPADETPAEAKPRVKSEQLEPLSETNGNVGRLMKATDEKFADGDGIRRRRVISQMRAAVAATKAERMLGNPVSPAQQLKEDQSPYRRDLDKIMPVADATPTETPEPAPDVAKEPEAAPTAPVAEAPERVEAASEPTPAPKVEAPAPVAEAPAPVEAAPEAPAPQAKPSPLVLVSSQRVDEVPAQVARPLKPQKKRVVSEAGSFAAFAEEMGAEELPDLLEAAAAFSAFVEGQPHFSRPEIMKRVAKIDPALSLSREAGLRSFGMLLRQGKIRKLQRGQFAIAEDTRFNPAPRIAGE